MAESDKWPLLDGDHGWNQIKDGFYIKINYDHCKHQAITLFGSSNAWPAFKSTTKPLQG